MIQTTSEARIDLLFRQVSEDGLPWGRSAAAVADLFGTPLLATLRRSGLGREQPLVDGDRAPCPGRKGEDCPRRVFEEEDGLVARCGLTPAFCPTVRLDGDVARYIRLDARGLAAWLGPRLDLVGAPSAVLGGLRMGERQLGAERIVAYLLPNPGVVDSQTVRSWRVAEGRCQLLAFALHTDRVPSELRGALRLQPGFLFGLDRVIDVMDGEAVASLAGIAAELGESLDFDVASLAWPRYWLVFDPDGGRACVGARLRTIDLGTKPGQVLRRLLRDPGRTVSRLELYRAGWRSIKEPGPGQKLDPDIEQAVNTAVTDLRKVLEDALPAEVSGRLGVRTVRATEAGMGGYQLQVPPGRALLLGRP